jgi:cytochrome c
VVRTQRLRRHLRRGREGFEQAAQVHQIEVRIDEEGDLPGDNRNRGINVLTSPAVADDSFDTLIKCGYALFTRVGSDKTLLTQQFRVPKLPSAGRDPAISMPLIGVWGQFPQYRAREARAVFRCEPGRGV